MSDAGGPPISHPAKSADSRHGLGPHVVGRRVVVRRLLRGETGVSGGPAFTDVLGVCESWADGTATIRLADDSLTAIATADIVSGKPVPPRPSRFTRLSDDEVELRATALFRPVETTRIGDWILRYAGGRNARPNSLLPIGEPDTDLDQALRRVTDFYAARGRPACAQVVVGAGIQRELQARGWTTLRPGEADSDVLLAGVAAVRRGFDGRPGPALGAIRHQGRISLEWLTGNDSAQANFPAVEASLTLDHAVFAEVVGPNGTQYARARINLVDDWAFLADLTVHPPYQGRGLARALIADLTGWAAEAGAGTLLLQVLGDNVAAQSLYADLGFERHHSYRHLTAPDPVA